MFKRSTLPLALGMLILLSIVVTSCRSLEAVSQNNSRPGDDAGSRAVLSVSVGNTIIADVVAQIGGPHVEVHCIVPPGENPHSYEPTPRDFQKLHHAAVFFVNGLGLEEWLEKTMGNVTGTKVVHLAEGAPVISLSGQDGVDPHVWLNVQHVIDYYVANILDTLVTLDPVRAHEYRLRAADYVAALWELEAWIRTQVAQVHQKNRVMVISENALKYFGAAYGFETYGIWEINAQEEGTPQQMARIINLVKERNIPALFVESTVDKRYMKTVSRETGVPVAAEIYTDQLGVAPGEADSYLKMMQYNVAAIVRGLNNE